MVETPPPDAKERQAKTRFFILILLRFTGAFLVVLGLMIMGGKVESIAVDSRNLIGGFIMLAGLVEALWIPIALARFWKSSDA